jgi:hypothetical protein
LSHSTNQELDSLVGVPDREKYILAKMGSVISHPFHTEFPFSCLLSFYSFFIE